MDTAAAAAPTRTGLLSGALTLLIDGLTIAAMVWGVPWLAGKLTLQSPLTALTVLAAYLAMCAGLVLARFVRPAGKGTPEIAGTAAGATGTSARASGGDGAQAPDGDLGLGCALGLAIPFAIFVVYMLVESSGLLAENGGWLDRLTADSGLSALFSILGILLFILVMGLFPWAMLYKPRPRYAAGSGAALALKALCVLGGNAMALVTAAHWRMQLGELEPMHLAIGGRILVFLCGYVVFLMFFAPPRLALIGIEGNRWSLATYLAMLAVMIWPLTA
jgi:hypothetical protein